jgi:adenylylsulfate kinase
VVADGPRALLLNGTVGVGKSTLAEAIAALLSTRGIPNAYLDMDDVRRKWPAPSDDPFNTALAMQNLSALSTNFVRAGVERLVVAGVMETETDLEGYSSAVGMPLVTCRLKAEANVLRRRLLARHFDDEELRWHLARAPNSIRSWTKRRWRTTPWTSRGPLSLKRPWRWQDSLAGCGNALT